MTKRIYLQGMVEKKVADEFFLNVVHAYGYKHGAKGISLNEALKLFNNYFKVYNDTKLIEVARENGLEPHEMGEFLIHRFMKAHIKYGVNIDTITDEEHQMRIEEYLKNK